MLSFLPILAGLASSQYVSTIAGSSTSSTGALDGQGAVATFNYPSGIVVDSTGNIFVADQTNHLIRKITPSGLVSTFAGSRNYGKVNGQGTAASFYNPSALAIDSKDNIYVGDSWNYLVRKITPSGNVSTYAGTSSYGWATVTNGTATSVSISTPNGLAVDSAGNLFVATSDNQILKINATGYLTKFAGNASGKAGNADGNATTSSFNWPRGMAVDSTGNVFVADSSNNAIRKITADGNVTTLAGYGNSGHTNGQGLAASFTYPSGVAVDSVGNVFVADGYLIRKINSTGFVSTTAGSNSYNWFSSTPNYDGQGESAYFGSISGITLDSNQNLYVTEYNKIRKVALDSKYSAAESNLKGNMVSLMVSAALFTILF